MISGAGELRITSYTPITGPGVFVPLAVNPSNAEYAKITGKEMPYTLDYTPYDTDYNGVTVSARPLSILGYNPDMDVYEFIKFTLINKDVTTNAGDKFRFVNKTGQMSYFAATPEEIINNPKVNTWYNTEMLSRLRIGEEAIYTFLQRLIKYDSSSEGAQFLVDIKKVGADFDSLYSGNTSGLEKLLEWAKTEKHSVGVLYTVKEKVKDDKVYSIQNIENNPNLFFITAVDTSTGQHTVSASSVRRLDSYVEEREKAGLVGVKNYYTRELSIYDKSKCVNYSPTPEEQISGGGATSGPGGW